MVRLQQQFAVEDFKYIELCILKLSSDICAGFNTSSVSFTFVIKILSY